VALDVFFYIYSEVSIPARSGPFFHNGLVPVPRPTNIRLERETGNETGKGTGNEAGEGDWE